MVRKPLRQFYFLQYDNDHSELEYVDDYVFPENYNPDKYPQGEFPPGLFLYVTPNRYTSDLLGVPIAWWTIISRRLWRWIRPLVENDVALKDPPTLYYHGTKRRVKNYVLIVPRQTCRAFKKIVRSRKNGIYQSTIYLDHRKIPDDLHIFWLPVPKRVGIPSHWIVISEELLQVLQTKPVCGLAVSTSKTV